MENTAIKKQLWTAGPEEREYKYTTNKVFCGSPRFMFVRLVVVGGWGGINALLRERLHIHKSILPSLPQSRNQSRILI